MGKKLCGPLFLNASNSISIIVTWRLYTLNSLANMPHIDFRSDVCLCLLKTYQYEYPAKILRLSEYNPNDIRYDGLNHDK